MASFVLSANPNTPFNPSTDILQIDTGDASKVSVVQSGNNVVITDSSGHTAVLQNLLMGQLGFTTQAPGQFNLTDSNGSVVVIGDNSQSTAGDDIGTGVTGGTGNDLLYGLGGNDNMDGGTGSDRIYGNLGDDTVTTANAAAGNDTVFGGQGNDIINYSGATSGNELIYGNLANDTITGGAGNDTVFGGQGNDTISPLAGHNLIYGNLGDDHIFGANTSVDTVYGGQGSDTIDYSAVTATSVLIYGNLDNDSIIGGGANDTIFGGQGNDQIDGGIGADSMTGGLGNDIFTEHTFTNNAGDPNNTSGKTTATADVITDFTTGQDKILSSVSLGVGPGGALVDTPGSATNYNEYKDATVTTVEQAVTSYETHTHGTQVYTFVAGATDGYLVIDANHGGTSDSVIVLKGLNDISKFDFSDIV